VAGRALRPGHGQHARPRGHDHDRPGPAAGRLRAAWPQASHKWRACRGIGGHATTPRRLGHSALVRPTCRDCWSRSTHRPATCSRSRAAGISATRSSIAPSRADARRARHSSRSSTPPPSARDCPRRCCSTTVRSHCLPAALPVAGKTGTNNDNADVWFIGFTPDFVAGVWMGFDRPRTITPLAFGGTLAAPIWGAFAASVYAVRPIPPA